MAQKRKPRSSSSIGKTILNLVFLLPTLYSLVGKTLTLIGYEAHLAGRSIVKILLLAIFSAVILATTWLCVLAMIGVYLVSLGLSYISTLAIIMLLNIFILAIFLFIAKAAEKNLLFRATRRQIRLAFKKYEEE